MPSQQDPAGGTLDNETLGEWIQGHEQAMDTLTKALGQGVLLGKMAGELGFYVNGVLHEGCAVGTARLG